MRILGGRVSQHVIASFLTAATYAAIFIATWSTDKVHPPSRAHKLRLDVDEAFADLQQITRNPHPYNSHANDVVHSYLLTRVQELTSGFSYAHVVEDMDSDFSISSNLGSSYGVYFEGTNILVKIDGSATGGEDIGAVLFSAHYDSVSTAYGATDDGMGVVTLLQMIKYLVHRRPTRTAVFNINNGEEDWLNGAHAFLKHHWSNLTEIFINLEGAASGGRPILFRATTLPPVRSFASLSHPHGNVLSSDAFSRGLIRSGTDYSVYVERPGKPMQGLDFAFYKGRSLYHTKFDASPWTVGGKGALLAMMETCKEAGLSLLNQGWDDSSSDGMASSPVYFDLFGRFFIAISLSTLFITNMLLLIVGPLILLLVYALYVLKIHENIRHYRQNGGHPWHSISGVKQHITITGLWKWSKFWLTLIVTVAIQSLLIFGYGRVNPHIIYSSPLKVLTQSCTLAYITFSSSLTTQLPFTHTVLKEEQKNVTLTQMYILTWALLLLSSLSGPLGGTYWITVLNLLIWVGVIVGLVEEGRRAVSAQRFHRTAIADDRSSIHSDEGVSGLESRYIGPTPPTFSPNHDGIRDGDEAVDEESTERTPLIQSSSPRIHSNIRETGGSGITWWIVQFFLVVPIPVILVSHIIVIIVGALPQTLADGSSALTVYAAISGLAVFLVLPLTPFAYKLHHWVLYTSLVIFILGALDLYLCASPFDSTAPLKVFFQQSVEIRHNHSSASSQLSSPHVWTTTLTGLSPYLEESIIPLIPSARRNDVNCTSSVDQKKAGLVDCSWKSNQSKMLPVPGGDLRDGWFNLTIIPDVYGVGLESEAAMTRFKIRGRNTKNCRVYFDEGRKVDSWRVHGSSDGWVKSGGLKDTGGAAGLNEIRLWSRTWDRAFVLDVRWVQEDSGVTREPGAKAAPAKGRVACEYVEYESGTVGLLSESGARIPAFEEILISLPNWAFVSKKTDGLVEVWESFELQ